MTRQLKISATLELPVDTVTSTILIYGGKGMGKSNVGSVVLEEMSRLGLRWSALDPMGVLWGLRYSIDGKGPGVECLILGGAHGDIPIEPTGGGIVAELVANESVNVIIDFSRKPNGEMWGVGERIRFVTEYGSRLYQLQGSLIDGKRREPLFQMIDEAARFMPQTIRSGEMEVAKCMSVWATIVEEGRNVGLGVGLLTQRSARLNKDVAELADVMMAFRTVGPNSIGAVMDWLGEHVAKDKIKDYTEKLRALPRGTALVISPGWLNYEGIVAMRARETFDSSATPKAGEKARKVSGRGAAPDLSKYSERMKETIERAKDEDPKALKTKIAQMNALIETQARQIAKAEIPRVAAALAAAAPTQPDPEAIAKIRADIEADIQSQLNHALGQFLATQHVAAILGQRTEDCSLRHGQHFAYGLVKFGLVHDRCRLARQCPSLRRERHRAARAVIDEPSRAQRAEIVRECARLRAGVGEKGDPCPFEVGTVDGTARKKRPQNTLLGNA